MLTGFIQPGISPVKRPENLSNIVAVKKIDLS